MCRKNKLIKSEIHILKLDESIIDILCAFTFNQLICCPEKKPVDLRAKKEYTADEKRILDLIPNVGNIISLRCPIVCSGVRGDGSRYREKCEHFDSYGEKKDQVFDFYTPQKFVNCKKHGQVKIEDYASSCIKQSITVAAARGRELIHHFGSADLEQVKKDTCLKCNHFDKKKGCLFKPGCKRGEGYIICLRMDWCYGDCDSCEKNEGSK